MKVTKFRCKVCQELFDFMMDAEFHIEHEDQMHDLMRNKFGISALIDIVEMDDLVQTSLEENSGEVLVEVQPYAGHGGGREWTDYVKPYPYYPYFRYGKRGYYYLCVTHNFETQNPSEFLQHLAESEDHKEDIDDWKKRYVKDDIYEDLRTRRGSTEHITDEQLEKMATEELKKLAIKSELTRKQAEPLTGVVEEREERLATFLSGKLSHCPICNLSSENLTAYPSEEYRQKRILEGLKARMQKLSGNETFNQLVNRVYQGTWNEAPIDLCLRCNVHLHLRHPNIYKQLYLTRTLGGDLPRYLVSESYLNKEPFKEELAKGLQAGKDRNLSKGDKVFKKWLEGKS